MAVYELAAPLTDETIRQLQIGDEVLLTGVIYMARDAAHLRMVRLLEEGLPLPVDLRGQILFYAGPCPAKTGRIIGPVAPTTASRMDPFTPAMFAYGVKGTIGKGPRGTEVRDACRAYGTVSLAAVGGLSAVLSQRVRSVEVVAYEDLGPEAIRRIEVEQFPTLVTYDAHGGDLYTQEIAKYRRISF
ncbi:FumA C-terminus/TtdB family hydratase beta subunit [Kyrpidia sp.]|uniref:FumA C-terminus/TtdB family hydratase beta subunit n=1 Tax=Kyrpidia sp. TaxID=2073077 RepID=UPI00258C7604|nr:FumA C-terminus/TtdB family hydratase beta subunit [Kyrpidia sp.]MCL6575708.1 FumA C-terminus/TtdB family hydratase beta subunit [Kyrpidia sp.]